MGLTDSQKRQREQCFLASYIDIFARRNGGGSGELRGQTSGVQSDSVDSWSTRAFDDLPESQRPDVALGPATYSTFTKLLSVNPGILINRLVTSPDAQDLFNLTPQKMSAIVTKTKKMLLARQVSLCLIQITICLLWKASWSMAKVAGQVLV